MAVWVVASWSVAKGVGFGGYLPVQFSRGLGLREHLAGYIGFIGERTQWYVGQVASRASDHKLQLIGSESSEESANGEGVGWGEDIHFVGDEAAMIQCQLYLHFATIA